MQSTLTFHLTESDIKEARRYGNANQLLYLLSNRTGTLWNLASDGTAFEIMTPYREAHFWIEVDGAWCTYQGQTPLPACVRAEVSPIEREAKSTFASLR